MGKILKELIIFILLAIVIVILLIIAFYEYTPRIMLSELEKYSRTEEASSVIQDINTSETIDGNKNNVIKSYVITENDLQAYTILDIYQNSRPDPFSPLVKTAEYDTSLSGSSSEVIKNNGGNKNNNKNNNSTGYFSTSSKTK